MDTDRIIILKEGCVAEVSRHEDLMRVGGHYASLVEHQTRGLILNEGE